MTCLLLIQLFRLPFHNVDGVFKPHMSRRVLQTATCRVVAYSPSTSKNTKSLRRRVASFSGRGRLFERPKALLKSLPQGAGINTFCSFFFYLFASSLLVFSAGLFSTWPNRQIEEDTGKTMDIEGRYALLWCTRKNYCARFWPRLQQCYVAFLRAGGLLEILCKTKTREALQSLYPKWLILADFGRSSRFFHWCLPGS